MTVFHAILPSPMGSIRLTSDGQALTGLFFVGQKYDRLPGPDWITDPEAAPFGRAAAWLDDFFNGLVAPFEAPLRLEGTPFQQQVWRLLLDIPPGKTETYGRLAERLGRPEAARAVGAAVGRNPITLIVPCHRVVGRDGSLTGYAGGLDRKRALLELEKRSLTGAV